MPDEFALAIIEPVQTAREHILQVDLPVCRNAWKAFADDNTIFAAEARLRVVADGLAKFDAPDIQNLTDHLRTLSKNAGEIKLAADDLAGATASHHAALVGLRSDINTQVAAPLVAASVAIAVTLVWIRNPRAATVEGPALESAATSIARVVGTFFTTLSGIKFSAAALATNALATITGLTILSIAGDATFNSNYKPPANAYDPNGPKAPGRPGEAEGFVPHRPHDADHRRRYRPRRRRADLQHDRRLPRLQRERVRTCSRTSRAPPETSCEGRARSDTSRKGWPSPRSGR
ncbi:hypothetical protein OHB12_07255 [Nocardia sp. NBC_01730]|uniref:hypothetical protein n=1 Tax=Nocardia sp. NBC_01730 TaxID=2975998 RepID=UPI002E0F36FF|nr:hypothetical protein OHB12_07255 [Nocardia sp. NBC_01730]